MTRHTLYILIVLALLTQSCATIKYPKTRSTVDLTQDLSVVNGDYNNIGYDTIHSQISIWSVLKKNYNYPGFSSTYDFPNSFVRLTAQGDKRILAQLYVNNKLSEQKTLKGRVKDNRFVLRRKVRWYGLPFLFLWYSDYKLQLSKDTTKVLFIDGINGRATWILIFGGGSNEEYNFKFPSN